MRGQKNKKDEGGEELPDPEKTKIRTKQKTNKNKQLSKPIKEVFVKVSRNQSNRRLRTFVCLSKIEVMASGPSSSIILANLNEHEASLYE